VDGDTFVADTDAIMERPDRPLAQLTEEKLAFRRNDAAVEIDVRGDRFIYSQTTLSQPVLKRMAAPPDEEFKVALMQGLERECRARNAPQPESIDDD
jgi:hypothetical protein